MSSRLRCSCSVIICSWQHLATTLRAGSKQHTASAKREVKPKALPARPQQPHTNINNNHAVPCQAGQQSRVEVISATRVASRSLGRQQVELYSSPQQRTAGGTAHDKAHSTTAIKGSLVAASPERCCQRAL
jgi:hypothetical protein